MDDIGGVEELKGAKHLVDEVLDVLSQKLLPRSDHSAQVCLHEFAHEVDVSEYLPKR